MAFGRRTAPRSTAAHTTRTRPTLRQRLMGGGRTHATHGHHTGGTTTTTTTTRTTRTTHGGHGATAAPVHHHKRHATLGDKVSGAMLKLKGSLTGRPGEKAAGTRRMRGTDGRGSRRVY